MTNKHFNAILAKNEIAREIRNYLNAPADERDPIHIMYIISNLKDIEKYIGEANLPCVDDIINSNIKL